MTYLRKLVSTSSQHTVSFPQYRADNEPIERKNIHFNVHPDIPAECYVRTVDVEGDGWCGWRVLAHLAYDQEDAFPAVKRDMLQVFENNEAIYAAEPFNFPVDELREMLKYGINLQQPPYPTCLTKYWFTAPYCAQIAADKYQRSIPVYSDCLDLAFDGSYVHTPLMYIPIARPTSKIMKECRRL